MLHKNTTFTLMHTCQSEMCSSPNSESGSDEQISASAHLRYQLYSSRSAYGHIHRQTIYQGNIGIIIPNKNNNITHLARNLCSKVLPTTILYRSCIPESTQRDDQAAVEKNPMPILPTVHEHSSQLLHVCQPI